MMHSIDCGQKLSHEKCDIWLFSFRMKWVLSHTNFAGIIWYGSLQSLVRGVLWVEMS